MPVPSRGITMLNMIQNAHTHTHPHTQTHTHKHTHTHLFLHYWPILINRNYALLHTNLCNNLGALPFFMLLRQCLWLRLSCKTLPCTPFMLLQLLIGVAGCRLHGRDNSSECSDHCSVHKMECAKLAGVSWLILCST